MPLRERQSDSAHQKLKELIIQGKLQPGSPIEESLLMRELGIGRTPLREALQRLAQEDLIKNIPRRGYFVADVSFTNLLHVFEVRQELEALAARLAAERINQQQIEELKIFLTEASQHADSEDIHLNLEIDQKLHQLVAQASSNPILQQILHRLYNLAIRALYVSNVHMTLIQEELPNYTAIVQAIIAGDAEGADRAMRTHLGLNPFEIIHLEASHRTHPKALDLAEQVEKDLHKNGSNGGT